MNRKDFLKVHQSHPLLWNTLIEVGLLIIDFVETRSI